MLGVHGRLDDMLIIKGVNVFPSDIEAIARRDHDFSGEYKLIVERDHHLDVLTVEVERAAAYAGADAELAARFARQLQSVTGVSAKVLILPAETLPRATHKAKRVEDRRTGVWG
jgi:phenylacetate-CoA ligase